MWQARLKSGWRERFTSTLRKGARDGAPEILRLVGGGPHTTRDFEVGEGWAKYLFRRVYNLTYICNYFDYNYANPCSALPA
jgi:hypothetical protein